MNRQTANSYFPSQVVSDAEKISYDYGLQVARAIEHEWFNNSTSSNRYSQGMNDFHKLRLYARGEQSIQKYKDELSINGDLSYLNLDWKPVPIIPKFVEYRARITTSVKQPRVSTPVKRIIKKTPTPKAGKY